jgi:acyl-CoA thioesterase
VDSQVGQAAATEFDRATAVTPLGDGRYAGEVFAGWSALPGPNGGYLAALGVRALQAEVDPTGDRQLRSLTCHYLRPAHEGEIELEVELVRSGKRFSTARLTAVQDGKEAFTGLAAFAVPGLASAAAWSPDPPAVAPAPARDADRLPPDAFTPESGAWIAPTDEMPPIVHRVKIAPRFGSNPFAGVPLVPGEAPVAGGWMELPEPRPIDAAYVALLTDAWWPPSLQPLSELAVAPTVDLTIHVRGDLPPAGLPDQPVLGRFHTAAVQGGLMEEDGMLFLPDGTLLAQSRQLALLAPIG